MRCAWHIRQRIQLIQITDLAFTFAPLQLAASNVRFGEGVTHEVGMDFAVSSRWQGDQWQDLADVALSYYRTSVPPKSAYSPTRRSAISLQ